MTAALQQLGVAPVINAVGTVTLLSGSRIDADVAAAMTAAAQECVDMGEMQGRASQLIAEHTGAEAGMVTSGASAGLLLGAAACMAGLDPQAMDLLPEVTGLRHEFVVARSHRNSYDHAVRAAGGRFVEVGYADRAVGVGVRDTESWEIERAITEETAGIFYVARPGALPQLAQVAAVARSAQIPLLVDAAAELPPVQNLRAFIAAGADLVVFSGGKALGGPSASGILCGRKDLVASALLQQLDLDFEFDAWNPPKELINKSQLKCVPRHGIGRSCKVGKEQIVGLLLALDRFCADGNGRAERLASVSAALLSELGELPGVDVRGVPDAEGRGLIRVEIRLRAGTDARMLAARLADGTPSVRVDTTRAREGVLMLVPTCLALEDAVRIRRALLGALK